MNNYFNIKGDKISSDLDYTSGDKIIVNITKPGMLTIELDNATKDVEFTFAKEIKVDITKTIISNDNNVAVNYIMNPYAYVYEFTTTEDHSNGINYTLNADLDESATIEISNGQFSDSKVNFDININLNEYGAKALHNVAAISRDDQEKVYNVTINNNAKETYGELNNFGVVKDTGKLIFNGTGYIKNGAKGSKAHQASKIITFDPKVVAQANPFLIIDEADVEASHSAAVGQMDEEQLFYLQSRGLDSEHASRLITYGYLKPVLAKINDEQLKQKLEDLIEEKVGL